MNSKERFTAAINHEEPDRVPLDLGGWVTTISVRTYKRLLKKLGIQRQTTAFDWLRQNVKPDEDVLERLGVDTRYVHLGNPAFWRFEPQQTEKGLYVTDEWGCGFIMPGDSLYYNLVDSPLKNATVDDLASHAWPDPDDSGYLAGVEKQARQLAEAGEYAVVGNFAWETWFERAWKLRAMDRFYMDMVGNKEFIHALLDKTLSLHMRLLDNVLSVCGQYLDVIIQGGDLAGQKTTLMSPATYREFIKPRQEKIIQLIKQKTGAKIFWHSCGAVSSLLDDFIDVGIDILNPVQVRAHGMDAASLKKRYGNRLVFWGGIDSQQVLPSGTVKDVENEVAHLIKNAGSGGGLVICSVHNIQADVPEDNVLALYDTARKLGRYPLT
ncbi:MAG: uroporphyrinogen decarboxylase family protein [Desulfotignum sp.]|jgi:uroporphyrinogen decarboxylase|nr:uroporphyrinogen decarboxylase family protein [Desulfotignum sp.]